MKPILILLFLSISIQGNGQVYVDSPSDIRFIRYRDSLSMHLDAVRHEMLLRKELRKVKTREQYEHFRRVYGFYTGDPTPQELKGDVKKVDGRIIHYTPLVHIGTVVIDNYVYPFYYNHVWVEPKITVLVKPQNRKPKPQQQHLISNADPGLTVINRLETAHGKTITLDSIKIR